MTTRRHLVLPCFLCLSLLVVAASASAAEEYVRRCCRSTSFPRACERSLVPRAPAVGRSPRRLAQAALAVAADSAHNCSAYIGHPPPAVVSSATSGSGGAHAHAHAGGGGAMEDCAELVRDAADLLRQSVAELAGRMGRASSPRFRWRLSNVQTWASAALTDADTCLDSLAANGGPGAAHDDVKRRVVAIEQATSNALALVNRLQPPTRPLH